MALSSLQIRPSHARRHTQMAALVGGSHQDCSTPPKISSCLIQPITWVFRTLGSCLLYIEAPSTTPTNALNFNLSYILGCFPLPHCGDWGHECTRDIGITGFRVWIRVNIRARVRAKVRGRGRVRVRVWVRVRAKVRAKVRGRGRVRVRVRVRGRVRVRVKV